MKHLVRILLALVLVGWTGLASAQQSGTDDPNDKQKAKEQRVEEYLRQKEQRRAESEARRAQKAESKAAAQSAPAAGTTAAATTTAAKLPRELVEAQDAVRNSSVGQDPTVQRYVDLIDRQEASPHQLAAFGNFLSDSGMIPEAIVYYDVALALEKNDPILWLNAGTLYRRVGELSAAVNLYGRALNLDPSNAFVHYNLGTVLDQMGKYESAIEAYTVALTLEPSLGDPTVNPQAANNNRLLAVKLQLYQQQTGTLSLPLVDVPDGQLPESPEDGQLERP